MGILSSPPPLPLPFGEEREEEKIRRRLAATEKRYEPEPVQSVDPTQSPKWRAVFRILLPRPTLS